MNNDMEMDLSNYYANESQQTLLDRVALTARLGQLPIMIAATNDSLQVALMKHYPESRIQPHHEKALHFVDDLIAGVSRQCETGERVELLCRQLAPLLAIELLDSYSNGGSNGGSNGQSGAPLALSVTDNKPVFELYSLLLSECIGWSEDLGALGEQFIQTFEDRISATLHGRMTMEKCISLLQDFVHRHNAHGKVREHRLSDDAIKQQHKDFARQQAASLINRFLRGARLPLFSIFAIQGVWYEFLQNVCQTYGTRSRHWRYAARLTDALIKSLQPDCREGIRENIPVKIRDWCDSINVDSSAMEDFLDDLASEYNKLDQDPAMSLCIADPIPIREDGGTEKREDDHPLADVSEGQWILFADPAAPVEKTARLRCLHNFTEGATLICSNMNRRKTICLTYDTLARGVTNKTARMLPRQVDLRSTIARQLEEQRLSDRAPTNSRRALLAAKLRKKRSRVLAAKSRMKLQLALSRVQELQTNAWVRLPLMQGAMTPCRLIAVIGDGDKYIFANRGGIKVAEYTRSQLANLMVTENSEILDTGEEFATVLDSVVTSRTAPTAQPAKEKRPFAEL